MNPQDLSVEELLKIKESNYQKAVLSAKFFNLALLSETLGKRTNCTYTKYEYTFESLTRSQGMRRIVVFNDVYGGYLTVRIEGKLVASTHYCDRLFVDSGWYEELLPKIEEAKELSKKNAEQEVESERQRLINKLF